MNWFWSHGSETRMPTYPDICFLSFYLLDLENSMPDRMNELTLLENAD